ncbi:unnamed protein product [Nezara viridula]|uniref:Uncharacterized protein n=1 Tax=Nezara viridula TaxID=85310 RepID=A0A9P0MT81_NEZVI|nr:unnamed protein product [Nezara viridula]
MSFEISYMMIRLPYRTPRFVDGQPPRHRRTRSKFVCERELCKGRTDIGPHLAGSGRLQHLQAAITKSTRVSRAWESPTSLPPTTSMLTEDIMHIRNYPNNEWRYIRAKAHS